MRRIHPGYRRSPRAAVTEGSTDLAFANYTPEQESDLAAAVREGGALRCPVCGGRMERRDVPPRSEVSYVRDRVWLTCSGCRRSAVFDRRRLDGK